jgi:hypothetical protein
MFGREVRLRESMKRLVSALWGPGGGSSGGCGGVDDGGGAGGGGHPQPAAVAPGVLLGMAAHDVLVGLESGEGGGARDHAAGRRSGARAWVIP